jgi:hypothetical protein
MNARTLDRRREIGPTLDDAMNEFHRLYGEYLDNRRKTESLRVRAGQLLLVMRRRVEAGEAGNVTWWDWFEQHCVRSRKDAERVMRLAKAEDPEAAGLEERTKTREAVAKHRQGKNSPAYCKREAEPEILPPEPQVTVTVTGKIDPTKNYICPDSLDSRVREWVVAQIKPDGNGAEPDTRPDQA